MAASLPSIVVIGASGHGLVVMEAAVAQGYHVTGWVDSFVEPGSIVSGLPVLGGFDVLGGSDDTHFGVVAVSNNWVRSNVVKEIRALVPTFSFVTVVHPSATVSPSAMLGEGTLVLAGAVINAQCTVAEHCIINTKVSLDHESNMKPFSSCLPGTTTGGRVSIGAYACICAGSTLSHSVAIGDHAMVGAGSTVLGDIGSYTLAYGSPACEKRSREAEEKHF